MYIVMPCVYWNSAMQVTKKIRHDGPDILRGFAALTIVLVHFIAHSGTNYEGQIASIISQFTASVTLFFTISAFSICYAYGDDFFNKEGFRQFYIKRFFRIAPLFYFALFVELLIISGAFHITPPSFDILMSMSLLFNLVPNMQGGIVWAGWSLSIEWVFYLLYPVIFMVCGGKLRAIVALVACIFISTSIAKINADPSVIYMNILTHMVFFVSGILLYLYLPSIESIRSRLGNRASTVSGCVLVACTALMIAIFYLNTLGYELNIYAIYPFIWMIMIAVSIINIPDVINNTFTRFLGKSSYSIYLMHSIVIYGMDALGVFRFIKSAEFNSAIQFSVGISFVLIITLAASWVTYKYIEIPGMSFGRRLIKGKDSSVSIKES